MTLNEIDRISFQACRKLKFKKRKKKTSAIKGINLLILCAKSIQTEDLSQKSIVQLKLNNIKTTKPNSIKNNTNYNQDAVKESRHRRLPFHWTRDDHLCFSLARLKNARTR